MPAKERRKGHNFERETANKYRDLLGMEDARRGAQCRKGTDACDVEGTPYWVECKRYKMGSWVTSAYHKAAMDSDGREPVLHHRSDRSIPLVTIAEEFFLFLLSGFTAGQWERIKKEVSDGTRAEGWWKWRAGDGPVPETGAGPGHDRPLQED